MELKALVGAVLFSFSILSSGAITIDDLVGAYVGKWTQNTGEIQRFDAIAIFEANSRVTTYLRLNDTSYGLHGNGINLIAEDGSFVIGDGDALDQVTLHGKHLHVVVIWSYGAAVEFQGHLSQKIDREVLPPPDGLEGGVAAEDPPFAPAQ